MAGQDLIELKFRLSDGTDIGPTNSPSTTMASLKEIILAQWHEGRFSSPTHFTSVNPYLTPLLSSEKSLESLS